jgi:hypothetical protein
MGHHMSGRKISKPGEFIIAQRGGIVGIVIAIEKHKTYGTAYKLACHGGPLWVFHNELHLPRKNNFDDLVKLYDGSIRLYERMAGLQNRLGQGELGERVQESIFELVTAVAIEISEHKAPARHELNRVMLDFGARAGFSKKHMAAGRAIMKAA